MIVKYYEGDSIYFRPLERADVPRLVCWLNDPKNWSTLGRGNPINQVRETEYIDGLYKSETDLVFGIAIKNGDRLIGCCGLHGISLTARSAVFGILIGERSRQGLGFGTQATRLALRYAFMELNLNRVELSVFADNERAIRAYARAGFVQEGRAREAYFRDGRYHDALHFAVLRGDWDAAAPNCTTEARLASMSV